MIIFFNRIKNSAIKLFKTITKLYFTLYTNIGNSKSKYLFIDMKYLTNYKKERPLGPMRISQMLRDIQKSGLMSFYD